MTGRVLTLLAGAVGWCVGLVVVGACGRVAFELLALGFRLGGLVP